MKGSFGILTRIQLYCRKVPNMDRIRLWDTTPPYYDPSFINENNTEDVPSLTPFIVPETRDEYGNVKKTGCVIVCPGGSYVCRADYEGDPICEFFNKYGISGFTLNYRVEPYDHRAIKADVNRAVRWVRYHADEYGIDPDKISVLGFSAGGSLATIAATNYDRGLDCGDEIDRTSCRPDAALLCYAVISMTDGLTHDYSKHVLIGRSEESLKCELEKKFSGELAVTEDTPPVFMWHTAADNCVKVENPIAMAAALSAKKIPFELHVFDKGDHGLGMAANTPGACQWPCLAADWLKRLGF